MSSSSVVPDAAGNTLFFELRDGMRRVRFHVADEALDAVSGLASPGTQIMRRRSFDRFRMLINAAANMKLKSLPADFSGTVTLSTQDLQSAPVQAGGAAFGTAGRAA